MFKGKVKSIHFSNKQLHMDGQFSYFIKNHCYLIFKFETKNVDMFNNMHQVNHTYVKYLYYLSLRDKFSCIKLCNNCFQDFRSDWGKHSFIIINTQNSIDFWQLVWNWSEQDAQSNIDILKICNEIKLICQIQHKQ